MKKVTLIFLTGFIILSSSCKKNDIYSDVSTPVYLKVQAVDNDNTVTESNILIIK